MHFTVGLVHLFLPPNLVAFTWSRGNDGIVENFVRKLTRSVGLLDNEPADLILLDELSRCASGGIMYGLLGGFGISIGPILAFASDEVKSRLVGPLLRGETRSCLAITEAEGGSDVANLTRRAERSSDGQHYVVNGAAKWITNGIYSDVFVTAVRTGGPGMGGISLVIVERQHGGVKTRKMECMGVLASGTSYVDFEDVKVPVGNLLGKENKGFQLIMHNFTGERA